MTPSPPSPAPLPDVPWAEFVSHFHPSVHAALAAKIAEPATAGLVAVVCADLSSPRAGERAAVVYGPGRTVKAADLAPGRVVGDMPSDRKVMEHHVTVQAYCRALDAGWVPPAPRRVPRPDLVRFMDLEDGDEFALPHAPAEVLTKAGYGAYLAPDGSFLRAARTRRVVNVVRTGWTIP